MNKASDYHIDGNQSLVTFVGDFGEQIVVISGGLSCSRCGRKIPDKEMFCIPCFGQTAQPRVRAKKPKPDDGGSLFEEELGEMRGEQDT